MIEFSLAWVDDPKGMCGRCRYYRPACEVRWTRAFQAGQDLELCNVMESMAGQDNTHFGGNIFLRDPTYADPTRVEGGDNPAPVLVCPHCRKQGQCDDLCDMAEVYMADSTRNVPGHSWPDMIGERPDLGEVEWSMVEKADLTDHQALVLLMRYFERNEQGQAQGTGLAEIAGYLGINKATAFRHEVRAKRRLARSLLKSLGNGRAGAFGPDALGRIKRSLENVIARSDRQIRSAQNKLRRKTREDIQPTV